MHWHWNNIESGVITYQWYQSLAIFHNSCLLHFSPGILLASPLLDCLLCQSASRMHCMRYSLGDLPNPNSWPHSPFIILLCVLLVMWWELWSCEFVCCELWVWIYAAICDFSLLVEIFSAFFLWLPSILLLCVLSFYCYRLIHCVEDQRTLVYTLILFPTMSWTILVSRVRWNPNLWMSVKSALHISQ